MTTDPPPIERLTGFSYLPINQYADAISRRPHPIPLDPQQLHALTGVNDKLSLTEVSQVYVPLCQELIARIHQHIEGEKGHSTFIIGIAGGVAVGKSTTARVIESILNNTLDGVALVSTDNFLYPNAVLEEKKIMHQKGFPHSFDHTKLLRFLHDLQDPSVEHVQTPIYSHIAYDIVEQTQQMRHPKVLILEGLNTLQQGKINIKEHIHFGIYVNATLNNHRTWFVDRFFMFRKTAFSDESGRWYAYSKLSDQEAKEKAESIYDSINGPNLKQHVAPTRLNADLIIEKSDDHTVKGVQLAKHTAGTPHATEMALKQPGAE